jgi:hypothetical protein
MSFGTTQVNALTDSVAKAITDFNTNFTVGTSASATAINTGVATTAINRVLAYSDLPSELVLLTKINQVSGNVAADLTGRRSLTQFYVQWYPLFDALDTFLGGMNAYCVANSSVTVNAWFAAAFNAYAASAVALQYRTSANVPAAIIPAEYFPYQSIDTMWGFTCSGATTFSANAVGANPSTAAFGGGVAPLYIYKVNAVNAVGGATFTISYTNAAGSPATVTYTTTSGVPLASGSLAAGYAIPTGPEALAITGVTGTGMTTGEQYVIGEQAVRVAGY